jgi:hypothetical protein
MQLTQGTGEPGPADPRVEEDILIDLIGPAAATDDMYVHVDAHLRPPWRWRSP